MPEKKEFVLENNQTSDELMRRKGFHELFQNSPIPDEEVMGHLGLFMQRQTLTRVLTMNHLYQHILDVHGVIMEFGVRWGQNLALFEVLRGIYEPYNLTRKIIGFDTFEGFPSVTEKDGTASSIRDGAYSVSENYEDYLKDILTFHQQNNPIPHIEKCRLVKGDANETVPMYLENNPETIVSFAYFDFDLYEPTKNCLKYISDRITKGTVIAFDELCHPAFPGETLAVKETLGLSEYKITRLPFDPYVSYLIVN